MIILLLLIHNPEMRQQMGQKAYQRYQTLFTIKRMLQDHEDLYQQLMG